MATLGLEYLRFLDGLEKERHERQTAERHQELMDRIMRGSLVSTDRYDEEKVFSEYFPVATTTGEVDYGQVAWDENVVFEAPSEDEMDIIRRMMADNSVTVPGSRLVEPKKEPDLPPALPDESPVIEQIETDREWV